MQPTTLLLSHARDLLLDKARMPEPVANPRSWWGSWLRGRPSSVQQRTQSIIIELVSPEFSALRNKRDSAELDRQKPWGLRVSGEDGIRSFQPGQDKTSQRNDIHDDTQNSLLQ